MKNQIELDKRKIQYTLKVSQRARRMRLTIYCNGGFVVTVPRIMDKNLIEQFILKKSHWIITKLEYFKRIPPIKFIKISRKKFAEHKRQAYLLATQRIEHFNEIYKFKFNKINIRNQKTRWGSCSKKGNLNFNYKIALLPSRFSDYIIVHELCHTEEFNHSKRFWNLVARSLPDYLEIRHGLKQYKIG